MGHGTRELKVLWRSQRETHCKLVHLPYFWSLVKKKEKVIKHCCAQINNFCDFYFPIGRKCTNLLFT